MLDRIHALAAEKKDFAFETTMASRSFAPFIKECKAQGYRINILFLWLHAPELAIERVALRVENKGHHVPEETIRRRYQRGLNNFFNLYLPLADHWLLCNNSGEKWTHIAKGEKDSVIVHNSDDWKIVQEAYKNEFN